MPRLTVQLKSPALHIKRDDLTGLAFGGNKTRMFEFFLAAACAKSGIELHLILRPVRDIDKTESQATIFLNTCSARILR